MNLLTPKQAAELLNVPVGTLAQWRYIGEGPKFAKLGARHVRYRRDDLEAFVATRTFDHTCQYERPALAA
jgi:excisionase family DNA binding protein